MNVQDFVLTFHITNAKRVERVNGMCAIQGNRFQQMDALSASSAVITSGNSDSQKRFG